MWLIVLIQRTRYLAAAFFGARRVRVRGWSMAPTLLAGEYILCDAVAYRVRSPQRGDVVLVQHPSQDLRIIKRIAALPGDPLPDDAGGATVPSGHYFVLGDALDQSTDSRHFGLLPGSAIVARAWLVYWPPQHFRRLD